MLILPETSARDFGPCCSKRIRKSLSLAGLITVFTDEERAKLSFVWRNRPAGYKQRLAPQDLWAQMTTPAVDLKLMSLADSFRGGPNKRTHFRILRSVPIKSTSNTPAGGVQRLGVANGIQE